ncbi:MAG TPA: HlyD family secretion protein [Stellaceae bacterium]
MADTELKSRQDVAPSAPIADRPRTPDLSPRRRSRIRILPLLLTLIAVAVAIWFGRAMWDLYMASPWTRDGTVRVYVVTMAPQVAGQIVKLPVADNQFVHKGDLLMVIDPTDFKIAVSLAEAAVKQARVNAQNAEREAERRLKLNDLSVTVEQQQTFETSAVAAQAQLQQAQANLNQARVNLERTEIRSPVNGWVTNLLVQLGDYATVGKNLISLVDADSFWVDGYFEETNIDRIDVGDPATIKLMGYHQILHGHVNSIARAINVANAAPDALGVALVNPIFTWVRLAQRIPVRIHVDQVPKGVTLSAGMTATVQVNPRSGTAGEAGGSPPQHEAPTVSRQ